MALRYDEEYERLTLRALSMGAVNIETFVAQALASGMSEEAIVERMIEDLTADGGLFGPFFRGVEGAARGATMAAARQGEIVGAAAEDAELQRLLAIRNISGSVIGQAAAGDPGAAEIVEEAVADVAEFTWIAELRNTCHRCLPLHGTTQTMQEWKEQGLAPGTIHAGWDSPCYCRLVLHAQAEGRNELMAPLRREKVPKGKGKSKRAVLQDDVDAAIAARDDALSSKEGRRMLRKLGAARAAEQPLPEEASP